MKNIFFLFLPLFLYSCNSKDQDSSSSSEEINGLTKNTSARAHEDFSAYLKSLNTVDLPVTIKGCLINTQKLRPFKSSFLNNDVDDHSLIYGQIATNGKFIAVIRLGEADCYLPILSTYSLDGKAIDEQTIAIGGCGSDCGFSCEEYMILNKDYSFYTSDTISTYDCDSLAQEIPGSYKYYVVYKKGKLLDNGRIEISEEVETILPGRKED